jgi:hypothetical protein
MANPIAGLGTWPFSSILNPSSPLPPYMIPASGKEKHGIPALYGRVIFHIGGLPVRGAANKDY